MIETKDLELVVTEQVQGKLITNAKQIRDFVLDRVKDYSPEKYIGKTKEAKDDRAVLNKASKDLNGKRLELERQFMAPFQEFKEIINGTVSTINEAADNIGTIISDVEKLEKQQRRETIEAEYATYDFALVPLDRILDQKWLNKTTSDKQWKTELSATIDKIKTDLASIDSIGEDAADAKAFYLDTLDIGRALQHAQTLKQRRELVQKPDEKPLEEKPAEQPPTIDATADSTPPKTEPLISVTLTMHGTYDQMKELRQFLAEKSIRYEKVT